MCSSRGFLGNIAPGVGQTNGSAANNGDFSLLWRRHLENRG